MRSQLAQQPAQAQVSAQQLVQVRELVLALELQRERQLAQAAGAHPEAPSSGRDEEAGLRRAC